MIYNVFIAEWDHSHNTLELSLVSDFVRTEVVRIISKFQGVRFRLFLLGIFRTIWDFYLGAIDNYLSKF